MTTREVTKNIIRVDAPGGGGLAYCNPCRDHSRCCGRVFRPKRRADFRLLSDLAFRRVPGTRHSSFGPGGNGDRDGHSVGDMAATSVGEKEKTGRRTIGAPKTIKKALRRCRKALDGRPAECYFFTGAAAGAAAVAVEVAVEVTVEVIADCSTGFGASCFWQPANARTVTTAETAIIAEIFFMIFHPPSSQEIYRSALAAIRINRIKNAPRF
jgi:hypothetical protein